MDDNRMSEQTPYQKLEVSEDASFEEIQSARDRLVALHRGNAQTQQDVEVAYDAILMDRLRRRQKGELDVPEQIRFAEQLTEKKTSLKLPTPNPMGLKRWIDQPSSRELLISTGVWSTLGGLTLFALGSPEGSQDLLALLLALGVGFNVYWINRKELKLGRAVLITLITLLAGAIIGVGFAQILGALGAPLGLLSPDIIVTLILFVLFWVVSNFVR